MEGRTEAFIGGEIRIYRQSLQYAQQGEAIVADRDTTPDDSQWWRRWERRRPRSFSKLQVASAGAYNRIEGLPINLGPQIHRVFPWGSARVDAYGVLRTGSSFASDDDSDVGHNARLELRLGRRGGVGFGGRLFNVVDNVEPWQLGDLESSLAAFVFRRDYRDYYQRHGASGIVSLFSGEEASLSASLSDERWLAREMNNPFTIFRGGSGWRPNPLLDEGRMHLLNGTLRIDTRNDEDHPWSGWYILADYERGVGSLTTLGPTSLPRDATDSRVDYARGFLDFRRYNRLSPGAQLNMRLVAGAWLNGDRLPLQRRFSVEGAGALPGYDFRTPTTGDDVGTCSTGDSVPAGRPAECERMALVQVEYRGDLHLDLFDFGGSDDRPVDEPDEGRDVQSGFRADGVWVVFADVGRGWLVGQPVPQRTLIYERNDIPPLSTFRSDIGVGLDFGKIGVYIAKALSTPKEPLNFFVRLRHRF